ncbi:MAG: hypothetical protein ACLQJ0_24360 [Steroidobacteraceae bacterium]
MKILASDSNSNENERKLSAELIVARAASTSLGHEPKHRSDKPNEPEYEGGEDEHIDDDDDLH